MQSDSLAQSGSDRVSGSSATEWQILPLARRVRSNTSVLQKVMLVSLQPSEYSPALSNDNKKCNDKTRKNSFQKGEKFVKKIPWTEIEIITKLSIIFVNIRSIWLSTWMRITGIICVFCCSDWSGCAQRLLTSVKFWGSFQLNRMEVLEQCYSLTNLRSLSQLLQPLRIAMFC